MNNSYNMNGWNPNQYVNPIAKGFCLAKEDLLLQMKQFFDLKSDMKLLKAVQKYFSDTEGRDPSADELKFIDRIASIEPRKASNNLITDLFAEDTFIGEGYEDLKEKLSSLGKKPPYSFSDIFSAGEICVDAFCNKSNTVTMYSGNSSLLDASLQGNVTTTLVQSSSGGKCTVIPDSNRSFYNTPIIENSDSVIFVNSTNEQTFGERFIPTLAGLIINTHRKIQVKAATVTEGGNLLDALLSIVPGAFISLSSLPGMIYNPDASMLLDSFSGSAIVIVPSMQTNDFLAMAKMHGLGAIVFGHPNNTNRLTVSTGAGYPLSLSTDFIKSLSKYVCVSVSVNKTTSNIGIAQNEDFSVMGLSQSFCANYVASVSNLLVTTLKKTCISYKNAHDTVLEAVCRLISSGVSLNDITASFEATVNTLADKETLGESLAMLLGLYRAQTELSLHSVGSVCRVSCTPSLSVTLAAPTPQYSIPNKFALSGSRVYLLTPRSDENGIVNFRDLKLLFKYIGDIKQAGLILSARAVNGSNAIDSAKAMQTELVKLNIQEENVKSSSAAFIIESKYELQGTFLGFTE